MTYSDRIKEVFKKYGRVGVGVHLAIYAATISGSSKACESSMESSQTEFAFMIALLDVGCYIAAERNTRLEEFLVRHGLLSSKHTMFICPASSLCASAILNV